MRSREVCYVPLACTVVKWGRKAILIERHDQRFWIPISQILEDDLSEIDEGIIGVLHITEWFIDRMEPISTRC